MTVLKPVLFVVVASLALIACRTNMSSYEKGKVDAVRRVLIAAEDTSFKRSVVAKVIEELGTEGWYFRVVGLDQLGAQDIGRYGAILLLTGYRAGRIDARASDFLRRDPSNDKVVLFYTRGSEGPLPERSKPDLRVDSLSSASRADRVDLRAGELVALIEKRF